MYSNVAMIHPGLPILRANVPAGGIGFKWARWRPDAALPRPARGTYAMNIRAADAIVSRVPKAMKIFPISEVLSRLSLLEA
jgi:hypothetical protein